MIDFDDCSDITMNERGVDKAVKAFIETNHYCPRPNTGDAFIDAAWTQFGNAYLHWSKMILDKAQRNELQNLPVTFLSKINAATTKKQRESGRGPRK